MNIEDFRNYCLSMKGAEERMPFGENPLVFFVKGKMFCATNNIDTFELINVKCDPEEGVLLQEKYFEVIPGYHMNKKHWISIKMNGNIPEKLIREWIKNSYELVVSGLPKKIQKELKGTLRRIINFGK